jgi:hypothetical protein
VLGPAFRSSGSAHGRRVPQRRGMIQLGERWRAPQNSMLKSSLGSPGVQALRHGSVNPLPRGRAALRAGTHRGATIGESSKPASIP